MESLDRFTGYRCPAYGAFPSIPLYRDQVLGFLNEALSPLLGEEEPLTTAMINNYVKLKVLSAPVHKKYSRDQVVCLYLIGICKQVLSMEEIRRLLALDFPEGEMEGAYNRFCAMLEAELDGMKGMSALPHQQDRTLSHAVICAFVYRRFAALLLQETEIV